MDAFRRIGKDNGLAPTIKNGKGGNSGLTSYIALYFLPCRGILTLLSKQPLPFLVPLCAIPTILKKLISYVNALRFAFNKEICCILPCVSQNPPYS